MKKKAISILSTFTQRHFLMKILKTAPPAGKKSSDLLKPKIYRIYKYN